MSIPSWPALTQINPTFNAAEQLFVRQKIIKHKTGLSIVYRDASLKIVGICHRQIQINRHIIVLYLRY